MSGYGCQTGHGRRMIFDAAEVERALGLIIGPGKVTELRALDATTQGDRWPATYTGYFDDPDALVATLADFTSASRHNDHAFDIDAFIARNSFEVDGPDKYQGGRLWTFRKSPMCTHHGDGPYLIQFASGALSAGCHHNSCGWGWSDLRARYEPRQATRKPTNGAGVSRSMGTIEPYKAFPVEELPSVVGDYVTAAAAAIGCDTSFIVLPLLACLARAIGNKRVIRLKRTWTEPAIIWAAIVGKSGTHKSPALQG